MKYLPILLTALLLVTSSLTSANENNTGNILVKNIIAFIPDAESVATDAINTVNPNVGSGAIMIPAEKILL